MLLMITCLFDFLISPKNVFGSTEYAKKRLNPRLLNLDPNVWIRFNQKKGISWHRQKHAGIAYDSRRGTVLIFGSDTHGSDWDNEVHEFNPTTERWINHYLRVPKKSYRIDDAGNAVAGTDKLVPWAMHTFDNLIYDPKSDVIWMISQPLHNPMRKNFSFLNNSTWIYDLETHEWKIFKNKGEQSPNFFAHASTYDPDRDIIIAYNKDGVWEIGPDRDVWKKATDQSFHGIHYVMEYDTKHMRAVVFGDWGGSNEVWVYTPGREAGYKGHWEKRIPIGDNCPKDEHFPLAFDNDNGIFLLVPDNKEYEISQTGKTGKRRPKNSSTFVYDLGKNRYYKLPKGDLGPLGMNYMMTYDKFHEVFLLITGDYKIPLTVWAMRLDLKTKKTLKGGVRVNKN
jgi:hypothetical protein